MTTDNELHVTQTPQAVFDPATDQWCVELLCGTFTYLGLPPFDVQWTVSDVLLFNRERERERERDRERDTERDRDRQTDRVN